MAERRLQVLAANGPGEPVAAQQVAVAGQRLAHGQVELHVVAAVERPQDHVALWVGAGLFGGDPALVDQALHERVVVGDLGEDAVAQQVAAGVPDVQQPEAVAGEQQRGEGGAHAVEGCVAVDHVAQMRVGTDGGLAQGGQQVGAGGVLVEGRERGDSDRAGNLSGGVPAHPVGDREQPGAGVDAVLVPGTQQPDVRQRGVAQRQGHPAARLIAAAQGRSCRS